MRRIPVIVGFGAVLLLIGLPRAGTAQGQFDPRREARFMVDANLAYVLITGDIGDSLKGGPGIEVSGLYQLGTIPLRIGGGAAYSYHGLEEPSDGESVDGSASKLSIFGAAGLLLFSDDTEMVPYIQARVGWTQLSSDSRGFNVKQSGFEIGALVGVDLPVAEWISIDVSGQFGWVTAGDASGDTVTVSGTSRSGSVFAIRAGAFFFF
jgi:hypothetical protein